MDFDNSNNKNKKRDLFINQAAMDQMNQLIQNIKSNSLRNFDNDLQKYKEFIETNFNNMTNILYLINQPIKVPYHAEHPLINCKTPGRAMTVISSWQCDNCKDNYSYNVPSFYCTFCDFDLCQKCLLSLGAFWIILYDYSTSNLCQIQIDDNSQHKSKYLNINIHHHPIIKIIKEPSFCNHLLLKCNKCFKDIQNEEEFHYCSLCNYCVCLNCFN